MGSLSSQSSMLSASIRGASPAGRSMATSARGGSLHGAGAEVKNRLENTAGHGAGLVRDGEAMLGTRPRVHIADLLPGAHHAPVAQKPAQDARDLRRDGVPLDLANDGRGLDAIPDGPERPEPARPGRPQEPLGAVTPDLSGHSRIGLGLPRGDHRP